MSKEDTKVEKVQPKKRNRLAEVFMKDYKYEGLILLILSVIAIVLGTLILTNTLQIKESTPLLGEYPKAFGWILTGLGVASLVLAVWPYYKPSVEEVKRVNWPSWKQFGYDSLVVLIFIAVLSCFYALIDSGFSALVNWLSGLK